MKFLVESKIPAREYDSASSLWLLCISHANMDPGANANTLRFSRAVKRPCASAYKPSAKSDSTGIIGGEEAEWINPLLRVRAVWLLQQPGLLGLLKLIYKASVYSGFPRQGKVNSNGPLDGNKSQHGCKTHSDFSQEPFMASKLKIHNLQSQFQVHTHTRFYLSLKSSHSGEL